VYDATTPRTVGTDEDTYWTTLRAYEGYYLIERADTSLVAAHKFDKLIGFDQARTRRVLERDHTVTYILSCHSSPAPYAPDGTQYPST
jgi:hypothetical protein